MKKKDMSLWEFRNYLRELGFKASYSEYKGNYVSISQAVYVWGDNCKDSVKVAEEHGFRVEKDGKRYMIY